MTTRKGGTTSGGVGSGRVLQEYRAGIQAHRDASHDSAKDQHAIHLRCGRNDGPSWSSHDNTSTRTCTRAWDKCAVHMYCRDAADGASRRVLFLGSGFSNNIAPCPRFIPPYTRGNSLTNVHHRGKHKSHFPTDAVLCLASDNSTKRGTDSHRWERNKWGRR